MLVEHDKRVVVYPNYIDSRKTVAEGRRIPRDKACDTPHVGEIADSCNRGLGFPAEVEVLGYAWLSSRAKKLYRMQLVEFVGSALQAKYYSRDFLVPGRVRVQLFKPDGTPLNPQVPNRRTLLLRIAQLVPKHPGRSEKAKAQAAKAAAAASASSSQPGSQKGGKKGKKGRK